MILAGFDLAPLAAFPPEIFDAGNDADAFVLALALLYNDLKDVQWLVQQLVQGGADDPEAVTPYNGQLNGMKIHATRLTIGIVHELLTAIQTADDDEVLDDEVLKQAVAALPHRSHEAWHDLVDAAHARESHDPFRKFLVQVRNNVAFHYYQPSALAKGYRRFFHEGPRTPHNEQAYASLGGTMELTRFYFADAAAGTYVRRVIDPDERFFKVLDRYVHDVNDALRFLIDRYIGFNATSCKRNPEPTGDNVRG